MNINGEHISNLRFADNIVVMANSLKDLSYMLNGLYGASQRVGIKINVDKTEIPVNDHFASTPVTIGTTTLEIVDQYVYMGQTA